MEVVGSGQSAVGQGEALRRHLEAALAALAPAVPQAEAAAEPEPVYEGGPALVVPLLHPFTLGDRRFAEVSLDPPPLAVVEALVAAGATDLRSVLAATADLPPEAVGFLRWPDAEALLTASRGLLPPGLLPAPEAPAETAPEPATPTGPPPPPHDWTDLDDDEAELPAASPETMADFLGV